MKLAFLGLGVMGFPMAGHLSQQYDVTVYNRTQAKAEAWLQQYRGHMAYTPKEAAQQADVVFCCVGNDDDMRSIMMGSDGVLSGLKPGAIVVDHTTTSAALARELGDLLTSQGFGFIDAPVSGGQSGAEKGILTIMAGAEPVHFEKAAPVMAAYGKSVVRLGAIGSGQLAKMANQICLAGIIQGLAEAVHFIEKAGLDGQAVIEVLRHGAAQSWQMDNRANTMLQGKFDFGFAVDWMRKDLGFCLSEARKTGATLPLTALVDQFYSALQAQGGGRLDTSSLVQLLRKT